MNGNKPLVPFSSMFTARVAGHPRVAYYPYPYPSPLCRVLVKMVVDEILVAVDIAGQVSGDLKKLGASYTGNTVFDGLGFDREKDVQIWRLNSTPGTEDYPDVAKVVWDVRHELDDHDKAKVAPNHVLVPSPNFHDCPWGPPEEQDEGFAFAQGTVPAEVNVTVIDAGYQLVSPIRPRLADPNYGEWFTLDPATGNSVWMQEAAVTSVNQHPFDQDGPNGDGYLDALAGHANFVAGLIAKDSPADIKVVSHNGSFVESDTFGIPTEASVARSLWRSLDDSPVITVGFAFPTLPDAALLGNNTDPAGPRSWTLGVVLESLDSSHVVVAPAGNQGCSTPQYPAAFGRDYDNVVGVGSLGPRGRRSEFSNYGDWVKCYVSGEHVVSTFISGWDGPTEEEEPPGYPEQGTRPNKSFTSGWAWWSGTSFAAPRVAAQILMRMGAGGVTALDAWRAWKAEHDRTIPYGLMRN